MKVYLDVFFAVNFLMNLLILEILNMFCQKKPVNFPCVVASAVGSLAAVILIVTGIKEYAAIFLFMYVLVSCLLVRIAYGKTTMYGMFRYLGGFYLVAVIVGGGVLYLQGLSGVFRHSMLFLLAGACLILFVASKVRFLVRKSGMKEARRFVVTIHYQGKAVTGTGFLDTGNQLYEPVSGECVTVVEYKLFQNMLSKEEKAEFEMAIFDGEPEMFGKLLLRYIPFHSLGAKGDYLPGIRVEDMEIQLEDGTWLHTGKSWIGLCHHFLSADSEYEMLLNSRLFQK